MKRVLASAMIVGLFLVCGSAMAQCQGYQVKVWDDLSWWGQSGATPAPVKDSVRSGYWWWPTEAASNTDDGELWGNRGVVYAQYQEPKAEEPKVPPQVANPVPEWQKPVLNSVLFDFDKAFLKPEGKAETDKVVAHMKEWAQTSVTIQGHTCDLGSDAYNMGLGQRRADAVKAYMLENGIDAARIASQSYGETQPAVPNDSAANRKLNRRAVFDVVFAK